MPADDEKRPHKKPLKRVAWFVGLYLVSVLVIGLVAWFIRLWIA
jgi:cell division septal protein FtsQ